MPPKSRYLRLLAVTLTAVAAIVLSVRTGNLVSDTGALFADSQMLDNNGLATDALDAPTGVSASGGASVTLSWAPSADSYAAGYRVYRSNAPGGPYAQIAELPATSFIDSPGPGTYYYVVRAHFQNWESVDSNQASASIAAPGILVDSVTSATGEEVASLSWPHSVGSGSNRLLIVGIATSQSSTNVRGVTYGGVALARVGQKPAPAGNGRAEIWRLASPPTGTATVVVTLSDDDASVVAGAISFTGVDQANPLGQFASDSGSSGDPSVEVSSASGEVVVSVLLWHGDDGPLTAGGGQAEHWNRTADDLTGAASTQTGAATLTASWTASTNNPWAIAAVPVRPAQ